MPIAGAPASLLGSKSGTEGLLLTQQQLFLPHALSIEEIVLPEGEQQRAEVLQVPALLNALYHSAGTPGGLSEPFRRRLMITLESDATFLRVRQGLIEGSREVMDVDILRGKINEHLLGFAVEHLSTVNNTLQKDELTGLPTQSAFRRFIPGYFEKMKEEARSFVVLRLDIDHFKDINSRYGWVGGDHVLKEVAIILGRNVKGLTDIIARDGGEEFAIVLPETTLEEAMAVGERIIRAISAQDIVFGDEIIKTSMTVGVAMLSDEDEDVKVLIGRADVALKYGKEAGRNMVSFATESGVVVPSGAFLEGAILQRLGIGSSPANNDS